MRLLPYIALLLYLLNVNLSFFALLQACLIDLGGENNKLMSELHFLSENKKEETQGTSFISIQMFYLVSITL